MPDGCPLCEGKSLTGFTLCGIVGVCRRHYIEIWQSGRAIPSSLWVDGVNLAISLSDDQLSDDEKARLPVALSQSDALRKSHA